MFQYKKNYACNNFYLNCEEMRKLWAASCKCNFHLPTRDVRELLSFSADNYICLLTQRRNEFYLTMRCDARQWEDRDVSATADHVYRVRPNVMSALRSGMVTRHSLFEQALYAKWGRENTHRPQPMIPKRKSICLSFPSALSFGVKF